MPAIETFQWTINDPHIREQVQLYIAYACQRAAMFCVKEASRSSNNTTSQCLP